MFQQDEQEASRGLFYANSTRLSKLHRVLLLIPMNRRSHVSRGERAPDDVRFCACDVPFSQVWSAVTSSDLPFALPG